MILVSDDVRQIQPEDDEIAEEWLRETDEPLVRGVSAARIEEMSGWLVSVWAMEGVRSDPYETEFRQRILAALRSVAGVTGAEEHDREDWFAGGHPSGKALVEAVAAVVDELADRTRAHYAAEHGA
jgi:hypothetical protein